MVTYSELPRSRYKIQTISQSRHTWLLEMSLGNREAIDFVVNTSPSAVRLSRYASDTRSAIVSI